MDGAGAGHACPRALTSRSEGRGLVVDVGATKHPKSEPDLPGHREEHVSGYEIRCVLLNVGRFHLHFELSLRGAGLGLY